MAEVMNTPFGDIDTGAVEAAVSGAKGPEREKAEEITIKFAKGLCSEPFTSKAGKEYVRIQIPNADPEKGEGKAPPGKRDSVKEQLAEGKEAAAKARSPKAKTDRKLNKDPER